MEIAYAVIFALFGAVIGSFLNVLCDRLPQEQSVVAPPSRCPGCGRRLTPLDMIPIISWLALRGRCRTCGETIPQRVFWVELVTALAFAGLYLYFGFTPDLLLSLAYFSLLLVIFVIDFEQQLVLPTIVIGGILIGFVASFFTSELTMVSSLGSALIGGLVGAAVYFMVRLGANAYYKQEAMGIGDIWLGALAGVITGWPNIIAAVLLSWILGGIVAVILVAAKIKRGREAIAFGPFLALTTFITFLWGNQIIDWYLGIFTR
ncbi:prepilin peptidase [Dehalogenimonas etheniformans]|uniref:Prepilin peptidase n=1 Tax=Dehalogenimonas etheniformans TaxID=1536648 RepID=A0A2P5P8J7_9CHLR|nr:A24 family peptidase [Dehalogenimonas etheniformans]PPD58620.1 prepilin peptidase [Dehalogenimonas etheniformans]QNT76613.1 prepilin peptidase [Dehalogenimonas etheniformans]